MVGKQIKEQYFIKYSQYEEYESYMKFQFQCLYIKFYRNIAQFTHLPIIIQMLSCYNRNE